MGIVNLTDDSYFAESRCKDESAAMRRIEHMVSEGADIIDLGACSTRPGSIPVGADEEWRRLRPVLGHICTFFPDLRISVDTYHASVVEKVYDAIGEFIVNDISAGEDDPDMLPIVGRLGLEYIAMHKRGAPDTMQTMTDYSDVVEDVKTYFQTFAKRAAEAGIKDWTLDPGFGFAKTVQQNYDLLYKLDQLKIPYEGYVPKVLVGISRKSMIYKPLSISPEEALPATQVLHLAAVRKGADILRVHDVKAVIETLSLNLCN